MGVFNIAELIIFSSSQFCVPPRWLFSPPALRFTEGIISSDTEHQVRLDEWYSGRYRWRGMQLEGNTNRFTLFTSLSLSAAVFVPSMLRFNSVFGPADVSCNTPHQYSYASVDIYLASALFLLLFMRTHTMNKGMVAQGAFNWGIFAFINKSELYIPHAC